MSVPSLTLTAALVLHAAGPAPLPCDPLTIPVSRQPIALTEQQESDLGDAVTEHTQRNLMIVGDGPDPYLQTLAGHILVHLPPSQLSIQVFLVDLPVMNAFAVPGGRIYVTRKLVAFTRTEDELAGVIGHEIGHIVTRQIAADLTTIFRETLDITTFGDRADIFAKYRRLVEHDRDMNFSSKHHQRQQYDADHVALMAVARAGYSPTALIDWWDRFTETEGRTGNFFTDLFGATRPESRRLREMLRSLSTVDAGCAPTRRPTLPEPFDSWRAGVIARTATATVAARRGILKEVALAPALRSDITRLRFSPDGRHVLAQDETSIYVLSREPFEVRFRIHADDAFPAQFTPDAKSVVFHTAALRVEWWDVESGERTAAHELVTRTPCLQSTLSPDGRTLGCLDYEMAASAIDVASGETLFKTPTLLQINYWVFLAIADGREVEICQLAFSPDSRYFIVGNPVRETVIDVVDRRKADLPGAARRAFRQRFAFLAPDRVAAVDQDRPQQSMIVEFPSGKTIRQVTMGGAVEAVTRGQYAILRPIKDWALGLVDLTANRLVVASRTKAFDVYDELQLTERPNGDLGIYKVGVKEPLAVASLDGFRLGRIIAGDVTADLSTLALSLRERGAIWDLDSGERITYVRGFRGVHLGDDGFAYADFGARSVIVEDRPVERPRTKVRIDLRSKETRDLSTFGDRTSRQIGRFELVERAAREDDRSHDVTLEVRDVRTDAVLWARRFPKEVPHRYVNPSNGRIVLEWPVSSDAASDAIRADPRLSALASAERLKGGDAYLEVVSLTDGNVIGRLLVNTGRDEWKILDALSAGDLVVVSDRHNQAIGYSLSTGERVGSAFGRVLAVSVEAGLVCVLNVGDVLDFYDIATFERRAELGVPSGPRFVRFNPDGTRLLVVAADQRAMLVDPAALARR